MVSSLQIFIALFGMAFALPSLNTMDDPIRILPHNWLFNITALSGPGCPDFGQAMPPFVTRQAFGRNTVDGSEIYYWYFAYPHLRASVGPDVPEASVWCETTLSYTEYDTEGVADVPEYRLRLHKNGTSVLADYELEEGVVAEWKVTYYTDGDEIVDTLTIAGPREAGSYSDNSIVDDVVQWPMPECGTGTVRYRTELTVAATKEGAKGTVSSEQVEFGGELDFYGIQQGFSFDFEKCAA